MVRWGQVAIATSTALTTLAVYWRETSAAVTAVALAIIGYIGTRWVITLGYRIRYWYKRDGAKIKTCQQCGKRIYRIGGDWILECKSCGWRAGWPGIRWLTQSVFATQFRRTVIGPQLVAVIILIAVVLSGASGAAAIDGMSVIEAGSTVVDSQNPAEQGENDQQGYNTTKIERLIFQQVNSQRPERGLSRLRWNSRAADGARAHAEDMAESDYFDHVSPEGQSPSDRYRFCTAGENIYQTWVDRRVATDGGSERYTTEPAVAEAVFDGSMNSRPHREQGIYGEQWLSAGVGVAITSEGKTYAIMMFCA